MLATRLTTTLAALAIAAFVAAPAFAATVAMDDFSYADGSLTANPLWSDHSGNTGVPFISLSNIKSHSQSSSVICCSRHIL